MSIVYCTTSCLSLSVKCNYENKQPIAIIHPLFITLLTYWHLFVLESNCKGQLTVWYVWVQTDNINCMSKTLVTNWQLSAFKCIIQVQLSCLMCITFPVQLISVCVKWNYILNVLRCNLAENQQFSRKSALNMTTKYDFIRHFKQWKEYWLRQQYTLIVLIKMQKISTSEIQKGRPSEIITYIQENLSWHSCNWNDPEKNFKFVQVSDMNLLFTQIKTQRGWPLARGALLSTNWLLSDILFA